MSENPDEITYITVKDDGSIIIEPDGHISMENIDMMQFSFEEGQDITESVSKKNVKSKVPVSFTKRGRSAYSPVKVTYPDGVSTSSKFLLEGCIVQHTPALNAQNHSYARDFVFIGIPDTYIDKIISDAKNNSQLTLETKSNVSNLNGFYWLRCNLDKLSNANTQIVTENGPVKLPIDMMLKEIKKSIVASIVFSLSGSMNNTDIDEELDLKDGIYTITMKPTELYANDTTDIQGPSLQDTNNRKKESSAMAESFLATGELAAIAARRLKGGKK